MRICRFFKLPNLTLSSRWQGSDWGTSHPEPRTPGSPDPRTLGPRDPRTPGKGRMNCLVTSTILHRPSYGNFGQETLGSVTHNWTKKRNVHQKDLLMQSTNPLWSEVWYSMQGCSSRDRTFILLVANEMSAHWIPSNKHFWPNSSQDRFYNSFKLLCWAIIGLAFLSTLELGENMEFWILPELKFQKLAQNWSNVKNMLK